MKILKYLDLLFNFNPSYIDPIEFSYCFNIIESFYSAIKEMYMIMIFDIKQIIAIIDPAN